MRAFQDRVRRMFAGSALEFIRWVDRMAGEHGLPVLEIRSRPAEATASGAALPDDQPPRDSGISCAGLSGSEEAAG